MKLLRLEIEDFRHIKNQSIEFGENLTIISGQNSTGKSSLLGWIAQACDFKGKFKTITGGDFKSKYSEIFRFCKENDYSKKYSVSLVYKDKNDKGEIVEKRKKMTTRHLKETEGGGERYKVDFDRNIKESNKRAIDFPVIYLGLKRLIPLATEKNISQKDVQLTPEEKNTFSKLSKEILILLDRNISSEGVKSTNKDILAMKTEEYGHLGNSAGQDNIGQIISSILSFKKLKKDRRENFSGGVLLIDEIDASLYAGSQIFLVENLYKFSRDHKVQVIFTTHSIEILEHLSDKVGNETKINFLELRDGSIKNKLNPPIKFLKNKIKSQTGKEEKIKKIDVLCEDREAELWCKNLLDRMDYKKYLNIKEGPFGDGDLSKMAESKHSIFKDVYFVLDGDCREKYKARAIPPRTIFLPENKPPEVVFYDFISNLPDDDNFWIETDELNFSRQTCFQNYQNGSLSTIKRWFKDESLKTLFGGTYKRIFDRWKKDNHEEVEKFQKEFEKMIENKKF